MLSICLARFPAAKAELGLHRYRDTREQHNSMSNHQKVSPCIYVYLERWFRVPPVGKSRNNEKGHRKANSIAARFQGRGSGGGGGGVADGSLDTSGVATAASATSAEGEPSRDVYDFDYNEKNPDLNIGAIRKVHAVEIERRAM